MFLDRITTSRNILNGCRKTKKGGKKGGRERGRKMLTIVSLFHFLDLSRLRAGMAKT